MTQNHFCFTDKVFIISFKDNLINYSAGPVDFKLNVEKRVIQINCTSNYPNMWDYCFITISEAWEVDKGKIIKINDFWYELPYTLEIMENYLDTRIYFGEELK